jgi:hypothetical protein
MADQLQELQERVRRLEQGASASVDLL